MGACQRPAQRTLQLSFRLISECDAMSPIEEKPTNCGDPHDQVHRDQPRNESESKTEVPAKLEKVACGIPTDGPAPVVLGSVTTDQNKKKALEAVETNAAQIVDNLPPNTAASRPRRVVPRFAPAWEVLKLFLVPGLILAAFVIGISLLGMAQRSGWIQPSNHDGETSDTVANSEGSSTTSYICPMMCVPPTSQPGRCPVCAMELVAASASLSAGPSSKIQIDPRSRRVAGIQTVTARSQTLFRVVRGVGEVSYDESKLKTLSAYVDGRIEELYADFTGIKVNTGDSLALIYSPDLYAAQVEYVRTKAFAANKSEGSSRSADSNLRLLESSRERLIELGMTEDQIKNLESNQTPNSRLVLHAPMSGTVIEKMADTGQYIQAGTPVYKLADLGTVWLVLELFPEDARVVEIGQTVTATTRSLNGPPFEGTVAFVEPTVDTKLRTVGVRVEIENEQGQLKPGEFVRATLKIPLLSKDGQAQETVVIPRNSLLSIGQTSLVYVEGKPGEFELRHVKTGPTVDGNIAVLEGLTAGENVVAHSTFLLDAQMQLQGNPSLIDPDKAVVTNANQTVLTTAELEEIRIAMEPLSEEDRELAKAQEICPITNIRLGSMGMGTPVKIDINGKSVFVCCEGCRSGLMENPAKSFKILEDYAEGKSNSMNRSTPDDPAIPQMELPQMELPRMELPK